MTINSALYIGPGGPSMTNIHQLCAMDGVQAIMWPKYRGVDFLEVGGGVNFFKF